MASNSQPPIFTIRPISFNSVSLFCKASSARFRALMSRTGVDEAPADEDRRTFEPLPGDRYLLCTDGLHEALDDGQLHALLALSDDPHLARTMRLKVGSPLFVQAAALDQTKKITRSTSANTASLPIWRRNAARRLRARTGCCPRSSCALMA